MGGKWLVIPTNRPERLPAFFEAWEDKGGWDRVLVVLDAQDGGECREALGQLVEEYGGRFLVESWNEMEKMGGKAWDIFSRQDSAIRCYGFWRAWKMGAEYVLTLDDDVLPVEGARPIFDQHVEAMTTGCAKWLPSIPGTRTRGLPYRNLGTLKTIKASMGLWSGVPDYDAVQSLSRHIWEQETPYSPPISEGGLCPSGVYFPLCGMNLCIRRDAIPCFYFPLMGKGRPFSRFDDIWAGVIAKKVFDFLGWQFVVGGRVVRHERASDPFVNLVKEASGIAYNETFWEIVDAEAFYVEASLDPLEAMSCIAERIGDYGGPLHDYQTALAAGILGWVGLFR